MSPQGEQLRLVPQCEQSHIAEHDRAQTQVPPVPWHGAAPETPLSRTPALSLCLPGSSIQLSPGRDGDGLGAEGSVLSPAHCLN